ncbi:MAG: prolyl oligopeptidase family serine peptidase [Burkholderiaceae bacterium]
MRFARTGVSIAAVTMLVAACGGSGGGEPQKLAYPASAAGSASYSYFGKTIAEPYQWMEDTTGDDTRAWVDAQNTFSLDYLRALPSYAEIEARVVRIFTEIQEPAKTGAGPLAFGKQTVQGGDGLYYYQVTRKIDTGRWRPRADTNHVSVDNRIYVTDDLRKSGRVLLDLNKQNSNPDDHIALTSHQLTPDGKHLVYRLIRNYSDLSEVHVVDLKTGADIAGETIRHVNGDFKIHQSGFFYVVAQNIGDVYTAAYNQLALRYHTIGQPPGNDQALFAGDGLANVQISYMDDDHLYFDTGIGSKSEIYRLALAALSGQPPAKWLGDGFHSIFQILGADADRNLLVLTSSGALRHRLVKIEREHTAPSRWVELVNGAAGEVVEEIVPCAGAYFAEILDDGASRLVRFDGDGRRTEIPQPGMGAVSEMECVRDADGRDQLSYRYSTLIQPDLVFRYDPATGTVAQTGGTRIDGFDPSAYVMQRIFATSADGTRIPVFIAHRKGLALDGGNPAMIYVYGGFAAAERPLFRRHAVPLLENGGIYAVAQVRGGSEYGNAWHEAGRAANKQNTYDDVIAVANHLIRGKYTSAARLGLEGGSNGGLTTAAVALQRPDLFKAVFPSVGVLDLLRYQHFTSGYNWFEDYGDSSNEADFNRLLAISPLHNVRNVPYPAMYVMTGQTDSRVVPSHSYKFAATMQNQAGGRNPYLLTAFPKAGHAMSENRQRLATDTWAFFFAQTGTAYRKPAN